MRVPDISFYNTFIRNNNIKENKLLKYQNQLASGKKILSPSDNAVDTAKALRLKRITSDIETYNRNITQTRAILDTAESTLANIVDTAQEARVSIIQVLNTGVMDNEDANILKDYFQSTRDYILKKANISIGDSRVFGGVKANKDPFNEKGIYQGENLETKVPVAKGVELNTTFDGSEYIGTVNSGVYDPATQKAPQKLGLVKALDDIVKIIEDGDLNKLHGYYSEMGYNNSSDQLVGTTESGTLTITYGSTSFSINYDGNTADITNPSTLDELVNAINSSSANPGVQAFVFTDKDGIKRLGLLGNDADKKISITDSSGALFTRIGQTKAILDTFDEGFNKVASGRSRIGTQIKVSEDLQPQNEYLQVVYSDLVSKFEDADYASVIAELEKTKTAYEALLASFNQNKDLSLLNFLK